MASEPAGQIEDSDFQNVIQGIADVAHFTAATPTKPRRGVRSNHGSELEKSKSNLREDMHRLLTSPHALLHAQPGLELSNDAITALRSLWTVVQNMKDVASGEADSGAKALEAAIRHAVIALDPTHTFTQEGIEEAAQDKKAPDQMQRKSQRLASKPRKRYDEQDDEAEMAALIGDVDEEDNERESGGQST